MSERLQQIDEDEDIEVKLLLEAIYLKYGYDFRNYSKPHIKRRIRHRMVLEKTKSITELQYKVINDKKFIKTILRDFSINVTEMYRDPSFFKAFREKVIPILKKLPFIKIWHAGCSTGEEVYSMAIFLKEEGLYDKVQIYATDFNNLVLKKAKEGIYPVERIKEYTYNYQQAGGTESLTDYYVADYDSVIFNNSIKQRIAFGEHNLVSDGAFGEMDVVICRNVLIYFNKSLQDKVINLFSDSLTSRGFLCLGSKESIKFSNAIENFNDFVPKEKIYRKKSSKRIYL